MPSHWLPTLRLCRAILRSRRALVAGVLLLAGAGGVGFVVAVLRHPASRGGPPITRDVAAEATPGVPGRSLTFTFWNLEWFPGHRPNAGKRAQASHVAAVVPVVEQLDPDVLGLEEVSGPEAAALVASHLKGFKVDVCSGFMRGRDNAEFDHQQIVLCSRLPVVATGWEPWKPEASGRRQRRGFVYAVYRIAPGEVALVYGLHLKSNLPDEPGGEPTNVAMREEASRQLLGHERGLAATWARGARIRLVVIGGDMNTSLDDAEYEEEKTLRTWMDAGGFLWAWQGVPLPLRLTLPTSGRYPSRCFDHVFYRSESSTASPLLGIELEPTGRRASDHRPVTARFGW